MKSLESVQCESCGGLPSQVVVIAENKWRAPNKIVMCFCGACNSRYDELEEEVTNFSNLRHLNRQAYAFRIRKLKESIREALQA